LQTSDQHGVVTPEGWHQGDDVLVPPPKTTSDAEARARDGYNCIDWYFCRRDMPE
jgi:peroxiredoxin (alkyl hydroperoxide reductase subunit C)